MKFFNKNSYKTTQHPRGKAFSLAEVLVTLSIIGVVASLTIPQLVSNYQKTQYVTALKKAYTEINQSLKQMTSELGCVDDLKCTGLFDSTLGDSQNVLGKALVKYFKTTRICGTATNQGCWTAATNINYDGSSTNNNNDGADGYKFVTADGMSILAFNFKNDCLTDGTGGSTDYSNHRTENMTQTCGYVLIDTNGLKKPNTRGRDTFLFFITNGKGALLYPRGGADDKYAGDSWWSDSSGVERSCSQVVHVGAYCGGRILEEGWQMNY